MVNLCYNKKIYNRPHRTCQRSGGATGRRNDGDAPSPSPLKILMNGVFMLRLGLQFFLILTVITAPAYGGGPAGSEPALIPATDSKKMIGYVTPDLQVVIEPRFAEGSLFQAGYAAVKEPGGSWMIIDRSGQSVFTGDYDSIAPALYTDGDLKGQPLDVPWFVVRLGSGTGVYEAGQGWLMPLGHNENPVFQYPGRIGFGNGGLWREHVYENGRIFSAPRGGLLKTEPGLSHEGTFIFHKKADMFSPLGLVGLDRRVIIPPKYEKLEYIPQAGAYLGAARAGLFSFLRLGRKPDYDLDPRKDYYHNTVFDLNGREISHFASHLAPTIERDGSVTYVSRGQEYQITVSGGRLGQPEERRRGDHIIFFKGGCYGLKTKEGQVTLPAEYEAIKHLGGELFAASRLADEKSRPICRPTKDFFGPTWGLVTGSGQVLTDFKNIQIQTLGYPEWPNSLLQVVRAPDLSAWGFTYKQGLMDRQGRFIIEPMFGNSIHFNDRGLAGVYIRPGEGSALFDYQGRYLCPPGQYESFREIDGAPGGLWEVQKDKLHGLVDDQCQVVLPVEYYAIISMKDSVATDWVELRQGPRSCGAYNFRTKVVVPPEYYNVSALGPDLLRVDPGPDDPVKLIDSQGQLVTDIYDSAYPEKGRAEIIVTKGGLKGLIDSSGQVLVPCRYSSIRQESQGLWRVRRKGISVEFLMSGDGREYLLP